MEKVEDIKSIKNMFYRWISKKIFILHTFQTICNIFQNLTFLTFMTFIFTQGQKYMPLEKLFFTPESIMLNTETSS